LSSQIALKVKHSKNFFINYIKCENIFTATEARFKRTNTKPTASQQVTYSRQTQTPPDTSIGATIASFAFLDTRIATVRTSIFFPLHKNGALVD
jgi:hypothetical protein